MTGPANRVKREASHKWKKLAMAQEKQERLNITLSKEDGEQLKKLQEKLNKELMMKLSMAQIVRRLILQASINS